MKHRYWLHYYSQQRAGSTNVQCANTVDERSPAEFLHHLITEFNDDHNLLMWSVGITAAEFKKLNGNL